MNNDPMAPTTRPNYPNDIPPEQIEDLISTTTSLQRQVLRKFAQAVLEEMRYHLWVAQEKCKMDEETIATLSSSIEIERSAAVIQEMTLLQEFKRIADSNLPPEAFCTFARTVAANAIADIEKTGVIYINPR